ncbi:MAG: SPOR domain-containing protein [Aquificaceae bacterium]|nr:SPOR domain-containing protein [Aquificaceae bacterium]
MRKERLAILVGLMLALVFFYLGLREWLKSKEGTAQPPPLVIKPAPTEKPAPTAETPPAQVAPTQEAEKQTQETKQEDLIAQKIREERKKAVQETPRARALEKRELKTYTVQVGAFRDKGKAEKVLEKAKSMGYQVSIVEEDNFYKVRLTLETDDIRSEMSKLRKAFGGAILKQ